MRDVSQTLVSLELLGPVSNRAGGRWNPGERAGFPADLATELVARGIAKRIEAATKATVRPQPEPESKASTPAQAIDKMQRGSQQHRQR